MIQWNQPDAVPRHTRRRRKRPWKSRFALLSAILTASAVLLFSTFALFRHQGFEKAKPAATGSIADDFNQKLFRTVSAPNPDTSARPVYPYSVIAGGVRNAGELKTTISKDAVVLAHYSDFNFSKSWIIESKTEKLAYVSYRIGNHVFWTKKKLRLPKGEKLITDGVNYARTRCGNRISEAPKVPTYAGEPSSLELNTPLQPPHWDPKPITTVPALLAANPPSDSLPWVPFVVIPGGGSHSDPPQGFSGNPSTPVVTPEPGTLLLVSSGFGGCWLYRRVFKKRLPRGR